MTPTPLRPIPNFAIVALAVAGLLLGTAANGQSDSPIPDVPADGLVTDQQIENAITAIESREALDEETRTEILVLLREAQVELQYRLAHADAAAAYSEALESAPEELQRLREELDNPPPAPPSRDSLGIPEGAPLSELERLLAQKRAELANGETALADLESRIGIEQNRPAATRERIEELRSTRGRLDQQVNAEPPQGENLLVTAARRLVLNVQLSALPVELNRYEQELLSHGARLDILRAQRDLAAQQVAYNRNETAFLQDIVSAAREDDATRMVQESILAQLATAGKHPIVRQVAAETVEFGAGLPAIVADIDRLTNEREDAEAQARQIERLFNISRQRLEVAGVSQAIGRLFAEERRNLPQVMQHRQQIRERQETLSEIGLVLVRIEEERRALTPAADRIDTLMQGVADDVSDEGELEEIRADIQQALDARRQILDQAATTYSTQLRAVTDLDVAQRHLFAVSSEYKSFLDQHLVWIPTSSTVGTQALRDLGPAMRWLFAPQSWAGVLNDSMIAVSEHPLITALAVLLIGLSLVARRKLIKRNQQINDLVGRLATDNILLTVQALAIAMVVVLPVPLALVTFGWLLQRPPTMNEFTIAVAAGLFAVGPFLYNIRLFRVLCGPRGVMLRHFGWPERLLQSIRAQLDLLIVAGVPLVIVAVIAYESPDPAVHDSVVRIAFVALMVVFTKVSFALANPKSGVASDYYRRSSSLISRLKWVWYILAVGAPVLLGLLALAGYMYSAATLLGKMVDTIWLALAIVIANLVVLRWLSLARRKIALERALEERAQRLAEREAAEDDGNTVPDDDGHSVPAAESTPMDLDLVDRQTRRLLNAGLLFVGILGAWGIWSDLLPALGVLNDIVLWRETVTIAGEQVLQPTTLADLLLALVVAVVTWVASRNLPGLMEIAVLQHLELEPGGRYTINTLLRYVVIMVGLVAVLNIIGWSWSRIQWLVAALSVGLGFGLQEIVANFVSGLIILFERPIRVGDTVTVGTLNGTVSKVRIRATTITDWDRKEIIVPNKAFITDQVINWTLSDPITRISIEVGIAFGSDVKLAHRVIEEALRKQPLVLDEPEPKAYFIGFGDSSLDFRLYVFSRQLADRFPIMHAVHEDVLQALRDNDITIPFPQRDLHVSSVAPGVVEAVDRDSSKPEDS